MNLGAIVFGNTVSDWAIALGVALAINALVALVKLIALRRIAAYAKTSDTIIDDVVVAVLGRSKQILIFLVTIYVGSRWLNLPQRIDMILAHIATVGAFLQLALWLNAALTFFIMHGQSRADDKGSVSSFPAIGFVVRLLIWAMALLLMLANLGVDVTALIAGLGVGGIAVALAVQNILGDLLSSMSIVMDKPFVVGDYIVVDDHKGTVEHIGIKTTRLRSISGEQLVFSNSDLLKSRLRNYKHMRERRALFSFGLVYSTSPQMLRKIPELVQRIIEKQTPVRFERAHFKTFAQSSLDFEVVYWVLDPDLNKSMDLQHEINLALIEELNARGVGFAFPTQSIYFENALQTGALGMAGPVEK